MTLQSPGSLKNAFEGEEFIGLVSLAGRNKKGNDLLTNPFLHTLITYISRFSGTLLPLHLGRWTNGSQWCSKYIDFSAKKCKYLPCVYALELRYSKQNYKGCVTSTKVKNSAEPLTSHLRVIEWLSYDSFSSLVYVNWAYYIVITTQTYEDFV